MTQTDDDKDDDDKKVDDSNLDDVDEGGKQDDDSGKKDDSNLDDKQVDYKNKFSDSAKEAIRLTKENQRIKAEKKLADKKIEVAKDASKIHEIAKDDPEMADTICEDFWGTTYAEAVGQEDDDKKAEVDVESKARKVYREEKVREEKKKIDDYEVQFFIDQKISVGSPKYNKIMETYSKTNPDTVQDSKDLLSMAYKHHFPDEEIETPAPNTDLGGKGEIKDSEFTDEDREIMKEKGWDAEKMKEFKKTHLYS